jgi:hypothetical protein
MNTLTWFPATTLFLSLSALWDGVCSCSPAEDRRQTFVGHELQPRRSASLDENGLSGTVHAPGEIVEDALVEVFPRTSRGRSSIRAAACVTDEQGRFCVRHLKRGQYDLVISKAGFNAVIYDLTVSTKKRKFARPHLDVLLPVAY